MCDPKAVPAEHGIEVPDGIEVNVVENSGNTLNSASNAPHLRGVLHSPHYPECLHERMDTFIALPPPLALNPLKIRFRGLSRGDDRYNGDRDNDSLIEQAVPRYSKEKRP